MVVLQVQCCVALSVSAETPSLAEELRSHANKTTLQSSWMGCSGDWSFYCSLPLQPLKTFV